MKFGPKKREPTWNRVVVLRERDTNGKKKRSGTFIVILNMNACKKDLSNLKTQDIREETDYIY